METDLRRGGLRSRRKTSNNVHIMKSDSKVPNPICTRCEILPNKLAEQIDLYISTPIAATAEILETIFADNGIATGLYQEVMTAEVSAADFRALAAAFNGQLSRQELIDTRVLVTDRGTRPALADFIHMHTLETVVGMIEGEQLLTILEDGQLVTHVQPIVRADSSPTPFAYECLTRGRSANGETISPAYLFDTARRADLLFYLDRESRMTAIRSARSLASRAKLFVNFNPATIYKPEFCLASTFQALDDVGLDSDDIVFEVVESDRITDTKHLHSILEYYKARGFEVALDDLGAGYNSLTSLAELRPNYMKLDIDLCRNVHVDPYKETIARNLLVLARDLGIKTIAEGIEVQAEADWFVNAGVDYMQGFHFSRPTPVAAVE